MSTHRACGLELTSRPDRCKCDRTELILMRDGQTRARWSAGLKKYTLSSCCSNKGDSAGSRSVRSLTDDVRKPTARIVRRVRQQGQRQICSNQAITPSTTQLRQERLPIPTRGKIPRHVARRWRSDFAVRVEELDAEASACG